MPKERFSDDEMRRMTRAAEAIKDLLTKESGYYDLLYGKWALLTEDVKRELAKREAERRTMFVAPEVQLKNLLRWNAARGWGFSGEDLARAAHEVPAEPALPEGGKLQLRARVLEAHLPEAPDGTPGVRRTFDELWGIAVAEHGMRPCHLFGLAKSVRIELSQGQEHHPGLRWRTIDLGYGWPDPDPACRRLCGTSPRRLPPEAERPHAGILAAAAHFPLWLKRMDGRLVPKVWLPGYELRGAPHGIGGFGAQRIIHHPLFAGDGEGRQFLYYGWDHVPFDDHAVPIYLDPAPRPTETGVDGFGG